MLSKNPYLKKNNNVIDSIVILFLHANLISVNDGIDLLIEAIQNAPDVKLIKKKVLHDIPTTRPTTTRYHHYPTTTRTTSVDLSYFQEDSISDSNRTSNEENNLSTKNNKNLAIEQAIDNEEDITQIVYYKRFDDSDKTTTNNEFDITTEGEVKNISGKSKPEKTGFDRFESALGDTRRYEVFNSDLEEEPIIPIIATTDIAPTTIATVTVTVKKVKENKFVPLRNYKVDYDPVSENRTKLDWIEENFGKEIREYKEDNVPNTTVNTTVAIIDTTETTNINLVDQSVDDISSLTLEKEEEEKKKKSKASADEVMYRKQMEFLNSLDYGTEKSEFDESELLKDDEKYPGDGFPLYFVR